ncbi:MAG: alpha/beta hydrolase [Gammaproteobacteria bacterium]|nr:alpha/beta hydrolase [Gammaproteobacteria bacterium]
MKRMAALAGAGLLALLSPAPATAGAIRDHIPDALDQAEGAGGQPIALPAGATMQRDVAYGADPAQRMDVYLPNRAKHAPIIFMVHGGAWRTGDKAAAAVVDRKVARWLPKGFIVVSTNYRLLPKADPLQQANDVAQALAEAQVRAAAWGGDPARIVVMGHSAGAHLVALLAADPAIAAQHGAKPWLGTIVLDSAALNVVDIMRSRHARFYDRAFGVNPHDWRAASPLYRLSGVPTPMLLVCSTERRDACPQAQRFAAKVSAAGASATVLSVAHTHAAINRDLGADGEYTDSVETFLRSLHISF